MFHASRIVIKPMLYLVTNPAADDVDVVIVVTAAAAAAAAADVAVAAVAD